MKILFVCSEFFAGMMPFGASVVNIMQQSDHEVFGVFVFSSDCDYRNEILNSDNGKFIFLQSPRNKFEREIFRISAYKVNRAIKSICVKHDIDIIHFLTEDTSLALYVRALKRKYSVVYTVHDLKAHDEKLKGNLLKYIVRYLFVTRRVRYFLQTVENLVTCSQSQYALLKAMSEKSKRIFYHNFPSLVTSAIRSGQKKVKELKGLTDYILFFGRLELYKGVDILYKQYIDSSLLQDRPLVIAGSGKIYFERTYEKEKNVIIINRYIGDEEINDLYSNASCIVYPYISATQSGVVSLAFHFGKPVIVSNIPFLMDCVANMENAYVFDINKPDELIHLLSTVGSITQVISTTNNFFREDTILMQLQDVYNSV